MKDPSVAQSPPVERGPVRNKTLATFLRFVLVGLLNTAFGYLAYAALVAVGLGPQASLALAFVLGVIWNYFTHARLVFDQRGLARLPPYVLSYLVIWGFNSGGLALLLRAGLGPYLAQAVLAPAAAVFSFVLVSKALTGRFPLQRSSLSDGS